MIQVAIQRAAKRRGLMNSHQLSKSIGVSRMVGSRLWEGKQEPRLSTLDKICEAWGCDLDELIQRVPDKKHAKAGARRSGTKQTGGKRTKAVELSRTK